MNINQLPENHYTLSSMQHPINPSETMWFVTSPKVVTYRDVDVWVCDKESGEVKEIVPYTGFTDWRITGCLEAHIETNMVNFIYPTVILPLSPEIAKTVVERCKALLQSN